MDAYFYAALAAAIISLAGIVLLLIYLFKTSPDNDAPDSSSGPAHLGSIISSQPGISAQKTAAVRNKVVLTGDNGGGFEGDIYDVLTIGRAPANNFVVSDDRTSGTHCRILRYGAELFIEDLSSTNGTFVNGARIYDRTPLHSGDKLVFGNAGYTIRF